MRATGTDTYPKCTYPCFIDPNYVGQNQNCREGHYLLFRSQNSTPDLCSTRDLLEQAIRGVGERLKVNVDGSCKGTPTRVGFGGVIRDHMENWIHGFSGHFGKLDILCAELHGMKVGLSLAWDLHYRRIILESDSKEAVRSITADCTPPFHVYDMVVVDIQWLLKRSWVVEVNRLLREANYCTDAMAKRGANQSGKMRNWTSPPEEVLDLLLHDALGRSHVRS